MPICDSYSLFPFLQVDRQIMQTWRMANLNPQYPHNFAGYVTAPNGDLPHACQVIAGTLLNNNSSAHKDSV